jgi:4-amino-4-deoxy-L-arabinose transferase-like glycosyltransferase
MVLLGTTPFAARFPSALAMAATVAVVGVSVGRAAGWRRGVWTAFILATSGLVIAAGKMCITDGVLLLWVTIAQICLLAIYSGSKSFAVILMMWVATALAILTKGPVVIAVGLATIAVLFLFDALADQQREGRWMRAASWWSDTHPYLGLGIIAVLVLPWLIEVQRREPSFLKTAIWHDIFERSVKPLEGHKGPPGYYLLTILGTYFPWCLMLPTVLGAAWRNRRLPFIRFALAAVIGPWVIMELVRTKLAHYILPIFPPLAFLTADALIRCVRGQYPDLKQRAFLWASGVWAAVVAALAFVPWLAVGRFENLPLFAMVACSIVGVTYAGLVFLLFVMRRAAAAAVLMGLGMMLAILVLFAWYLPRASFLWVPQRVAQILLREGATRKGDVVMIDFTEDSLPYYQGGSIRAEEDVYFKQPPQTWVTWIVTTRDLWQKLPDQVQGHFNIIGTVRGLSYANRGRNVEVLVLRKR